MTSVVSWFLPARRCLSLSCTSLVQSHCSSAFGARKQPSPSFLQLAESTHFAQPVGYSCLYKHHISMDILRHKNIAIYSLLYEKAPKTLPSCYQPYKIIDDVTHQIEDFVPTVSLEDPCLHENAPLEAAKSDIKWRRRRMRRHRLLRWRKKFRNLVKEREERKVKNRAKKRQEDLEKSWQMFGLTKEPPKLSDEEKARLQQMWREEGVWSDPLTVKEYKNFARITSIRRKTDTK